MGNLLKVMHWKIENAQAQQARGEISGLTGEIHIPEIVVIHGPNSFSQNMTKPADKFPQPFPHVLSRHV